MKAWVDKSGRWSFGASASSVIAAFVASVCCVGPLVFALLGLGGAGLLVRFEPYRPYFMMGTFALLGVGFYFTYRNPKMAAAIEVGPGCECPNPRANRAGKVMLWVATILVVGFLSLPYIAPRLFGSTTEAPVAGDVALTKAVSLTVEGMTCASCSVGVRTALKKVDGVTEANVSVADKRAVVDYEPAKVTPLELIAAINNLGYRASMASGL